MSGKSTTPGKQLEKLLNLVIIGIALMRQAGHQFSYENWLQIIISIALKRKQVINFLRKLVTNYNRNYANQEYRKEESIYFHRQVLKKESLYE